MVKKKKVIPIFLSIMMFAIHISSCSLIVYASEHGGGGSGSKYINEDGTINLVDNSIQILTYIIGQARAVVTGDFLTYLQNDEKFEELYNPDYVKTTVDGEGIEISSDLTAYIKQALVEYNEETCGYTILQTIPYNYITPPLFYRKTEYDAYRAMIEKCEMFSIGGTSGSGGAQIYFVDLSPYYEENLQAVAYYGVNYNTSNCIVRFYRENWTYYGFGINAYSFDRNGILQEDSDGDRWNGDYAKLFLLEKGEISTFSSLPYSSYNGHYWYVFSKDGRRIRVWNSLDAMKYGSTGTRSVYFGSDFYNEPTEITVSFDELANFDTTKIEIEQNRCAMACQGCGAVFSTSSKIGSDRIVPR